MPGATPTAGRALAVGLVVSALLLAGCGRSAPNPYALPEYTAASPGSTGAPGSAPRTSATGPSKIERVATPSPQVRFTPADARGQGAWAERGRIVARNGTEKAVATAIVKYLSVRVQLSNTWTVDEPALAATAADQALTSARDRADRQRERGWRSIGRFVVNISSVQVKGDRATATGCHFDATSEVDKDGNVPVPPPGGVLITMKLQRTGRTWRVLDWPTKPVPACDWRS